MLLLILLYLTVLLETRSFLHLKYIATKSHKSKYGDMFIFMADSESSDKPKESKPKEVEDAISKIMEMLAAKAGSVDLSKEDTDDNIEILKGQFQKMLRNVKSDELTDIEKSVFYTEAKLTLNNYEAQDKMKLSKYDSSFPSSKFYSESVAPYICVHSNGKVGQALKNSLKSLGTSISNVKYIDADRLLGMQDSELKFICKGARTVLLACDADTSNVKKGWFDAEPAFTSLSSTGLKRIFNTVLNENIKAGVTNTVDPQASPVKVITLCKGNKDSKSIGSLLAGDTFDLENEVILLCNQRNFNYAIVKVGNIIDDSDTNTIIPESNTIKRFKDTYFSEKSSSTTASGKVSDNVKTKNLNRPILISLSRIDNSDYTKANVAAECMLRLANYPLLNTTFSILSTPSAMTVAPTAADYDDELGRLIGPELHRIPLKYASVSQAILKLNRAMSKLQTPNSGLITPIVIEKYSNALRVLFQPKDSSYISSKEEKLATMESSEIIAVKPSVVSKTRPTGYISPEMEAKFEKEEEESARLAAISESSSSNAVSTSTSSKELLNKQKQAKLKLEGGLEFLVDELPYKRLRIRRCNMGPRTVVKEESEALIIKSVLSSIQILENDYRIMLDTDLASLSKLN